MWYVLKLVKISTLPFSYVILYDFLFKVDENFHDTLSEDTTLAVQRLINRMLISLAKEPKEIKGECDVVSIIEKEVTVFCWSHRNTKTYLPFLQTGNHFVALRNRSTKATL